MNNKIENRKNEEKDFLEGREEEKTYHHLDTTTTDNEKQMSIASQIMNHMQSRVQHLSHNWKRVLSSIDDKSFYNRCRNAEIVGEKYKKQKIIKEFRNGIDTIVNSNKNNDDDNSNDNDSIEFRKLKAKLRGLNICTNFAIMEVLPDIIHSHIQEMQHSNNLGIDNDNAANPTHYYFKSRSNKRRRSISEGIIEKNSMLEKDIETGTTALRWMKPRRNSGTDFIRIRSESYSF